MSKDFITFDTETENGKAFLVCVDDGKKTDNLLLETKQHVIDLFHELHAKANTAFAYNLEYDVCALLKYFGYNAILDLYLQKTLRYENMFIRSVPNKFLIITKYYQHKKELSHTELKKIIYHSDSADAEYPTDKLLSNIEEYNRHCSRRDKLRKKEFFAFDMWQFYEMPLNKAAEKFLGETKDDIPADWLPQLKKKFQIPQCKQRIIKYCAKDARLTHRLSAKFINMLHDCGIHPKRFYSSAYIAKNFIRANVDVPIINEGYDNGKGKAILKFMEPVFRGGRTEVFQRGWFPKSYLSDMNSAYGKGLADLKRIYHVQLDEKINKSADYCFIDCDIYLPKNYINPVPLFFNMWKYPYGKMRAVIDNRTANNVKKAGGKILKVHRALNVFCNEDYPFRAIIQKMFSQRKKSDSHNYVFKRIIVSYIGKLHEQKSFIRLLSESEKPRVLQNLEQHGRMQEDFEQLIKSNCPTCYYLGKVQNTCRNSVCREYRKEYKNVKEPPTIHYQGENIFATERRLGNGTNIIYAALVTSTIRNIIYEKGVELGQDLIAFLTDGILSKRPLKNYGDKLGEFSLKYSGSLYLLGSGMYQTEEYVKFRGFNSDKVNLIKLSKQYKKSKVMKIPILERTGVGRAIGSLQKFNDFNVLKPSHKKLNVNFDTNRIWRNPFKNYGEALKKNINSEPVGIGH